MPTNPLLSNALWDYLKASNNGNQSNATNDYNASVGGLDDPASALTQSGYLTDMLKNNINGQNPVIAQERQTGTTSINNNTAAGLTKLKQQGSMSGFRGADPNSISQLYTGASDSMTGLNAQLGVQDAGFRSNAITQLLGLQGQQLQENQGNQNRQLQMLQTLMSGRQNFDQLHSQQNAQNQSGWGSAIGGLLKGAGEVGAAALMGG
jgi:hypothetical protein